MRMRRIAFNLLTLLSLILAGVTVVSWAISYRDTTGLWLQRGRGYDLTSLRGDLVLRVIERQRSIVTLNGKTQPTNFQPAPFADEWKVGLADLAYQYELRYMLSSGVGSFDAQGNMTIARAITTYAVTLRHWHVLLATAALPALWLVTRGRRTRRRRIAAGQCPGCGYDLRATPDRCPECGAASEQAVASVYR
jgi:hypothetical protein